MMCATATEDAMVEFVKANAAVISKYRVTTPVAVLKRIIHLLGENAEHALGTAPNYLGGDAQVATQVVLHDVGAALIFRDPIGASGAAADCEALLRVGAVPERADRHEATPAHVTSCSRYLLLTLPPAHVTSRALRADSSSTCTTS